MTIVSVTVNVGGIDVDLSEISSEDLEAEFLSRGFAVPLNEEIQENIQNMFDAFKIQDDEKAMSLAKKIAVEYTGRIL
jgi:hypothetical protein